MPRARAAAASAWAWLPAEAATTPRAQPLSPSAASLAETPRTLNEPERCRFSALSTTVPPARSDSVREERIGVRRANSSTAGRAARTSSGVTVTSVGEGEDRLDLHLRAERQGGHADRAARGGIVREVAAVRLVDVGERADVGDEDAHAHGVVERGARGGGDDGQVVQAAARLVADRALDELAGAGV